jgi:CheY-like chemotaxis protein
MNLLANAAESISGAGEVTIGTENRYLDRPVRGYDTVREGDYVVLTVTDTGRGISAADIDKIFEPFYTKKVMGRSGTGLGLAVVWGTVKDHRGCIDVQSEEGRGSAFTLYFPATREAPDQEKRPPSIEDHLGQGERILVIDDVREQRDLAVSMLTRLGYRVSAVAGGEEALSFLAKEPADLIVLDMIMDPGMDGLETYRRICEIHPGQKAIIVSGFSETERVREAQRLGAGLYVKKPYVLEKIAAAVRYELEKV